MAKETPINSAQWEHPALTFDEALGIADKIKKMGGIATSDQLAKALGMKQGGWYAVQLVSVKRWNLIEGRGDLKITDYFRRITSPRSPGDDSKARIEVFLSVPLFKSLYDKYREDGLPQDPFFTNVLRDDYGLKGRNPSLAGTIIRDFVDKYMPGFKTDVTLSTGNQTPLQAIPNHGGSTVGDILSSQHTMMAKDSILIQTGFTEPFKWNITKEADFSLIRSVIDSIEAEWNIRKDHMRKPSGIPQGSEGENRGE